MTNKSKAIQFAGKNTSVVHQIKGEAFTDSLIIAQEFGRQHKNVLQSLDNLLKDGTISRLESKPRNYIDARGKQQRKIELTEKSALIAMPFIGGKKSKQGQVLLVNAFMTLRAEAANSPRWIDARQGASIGYVVMTDALLDTRTEQGKETKPCHYTNEARLLNFAVFGEYATDPRNVKTAKDLSLLAKVEMRNAHMISIGKTYTERKTALVKFVQSVRSKDMLKLGNAA